MRCPFFGKKIMIDSSYEILQFYANNRASLTATEKKKRDTAFP
jgi:hypothetical protein